MILHTFLMLGSICLLALVLELDFFTALPKFGAKHFGAPDDLKALVEKMPDRPLPVVLAGLVILFAAFAGIAAVLVWAVLDTWKNAPNAASVFCRFLTLLWGYKLFDIVCFDWLLLTRIRLPERLCPETKGAKGYDSFGFNAKSQLEKLVLFFLLALAAAAVFAVLKQ